MGLGNKGVPFDMIAVLFGGPGVGYSGGKVPLPCKSGETLVCLAQRGECRHNRRHYSWGLESSQSWTLPQIEPGCSRECGYRRAVADPEVDKGVSLRSRHFDPYGYGYYKTPSDQCGYRKRQHEERLRLSQEHGIEPRLLTGYYGHNAATCPECSQPKPEPVDEWVDVVLVEQYTGGMGADGMLEIDMREKRVPRMFRHVSSLDDLDTTEATKAVIRSKIGNSEDPG